MDNQQAKELLEKYVNGVCTPDEQSWVESWYLKLNDNSDTITDEEIEEAYDLVKRNLPVIAPAKSTVQLWPRIAAAASVILIISVATYFSLHKEVPNRSKMDLAAQILPGKNKAILTLSNGSKISLTDANSGMLATQGGVSIVKNKQGVLSYQTKHALVIDNTTYNTIVTPRGGQCPVIILPDGTKAILDASSSIKFPVAFNGNKRRVIITGQVYFEVVHRTKQPFEVSAGQQIIRDMGTHFNVNAYADEPVIKTSLAEGKVSVTRNGKTVELNPGQSAVTKTGENTIEVYNTDVNNDIAWINGETSFKHRKLSEIMRQVSRWYDVDVEFRGNVTDRDFNGGIPRKSNLASLLKVLELNDVHFELQDKKIIIKP